MSAEFAMGVLQPLIAGLGVAAVIGIVKIHQKVSSLNGTIAALKAWCEQHEKQCNERHEDRLRWETLHMANQHGKR